MSVPGKQDKIIIEYQNTANQISRTTGKEEIMISVGTVEDNRP